MTGVQQKFVLPRYEENRERARRFVKSWAGEKREPAEEGTFGSELLVVFGVDRRQVAPFELVAQRDVDGQLPDDRLVASFLLLQSGHPGAIVHVATSDINVQDELGAVGLRHVEPPDPRATARSGLGK